MNERMFWMRAFLWGMIGLFLVGSTWGNLAGAAEKGASIVVAIWQGQQPDEITKSFEQKTGIKVIKEYIESNEGMMAKMNVGGGAWDVIFPTQYAVDGMIKAGLLAQLDQNNLPNARYIDPFFRKLRYDPGNKFSIPNHWGWTSIAINTEYVKKDEITSWKALWNKKYKGKIAQIDSLRNTPATAAKVLGYNINTRNPQELKEIEKLLLEQKPLLAAYDSNPGTSLVTGDYWLGACWVNTILQIRKDKPSLQVVFPVEGPIIWLQTLAVPKTSKRKKEAEMYINFLRDPEVAGRAAAYHKVSVVAEASKKFLPVGDSKDPLLYPPQSFLEKADYLSDIGDDIKIYSALWIRVKAAQ